ncbi:MAG: serine/threonine-protein kinase, partial [Gemmataceae bacterium]
MPDPHLPPSVDPDRTADRSVSAADPITVDVTADSTDPRSPDAPPGMPVIPGYCVTGEIARGGMGRVFAAVDLTLDREVAIKTLLPGADPTRFVTESKITAKLPHPGIPPVYALGTLADGTPFLAMKLIHGRTLAEQLKARPTPQHDLPRFVQTFEQVAQAVGFAHSRGVIHRDLKPLNVMAGAFGEVQVMDWGLARTLAPLAAAGRGAGGEGVPDSASSELTRAGAVMGTPGYMAPEQARGEAVDARADVFALGSTLAAILTGKPAFVGATVGETIAKAAAADLADVLARLAGCGADAELVALAKRCLSAKPDDRPADGRAVADEVAAYRAGVEARLKQAETARAEAVVREGEQRKRRWVVQWAGGIIAAVLLAGTTVSLWQMFRAMTAEGQAKTNEQTAVTERDAKGIALKDAETNLGYARKSNHILGSVFAGLDPKANYQTVADLQQALTKNLRKAVAELDGTALGDAKVVAELQYTLGVSLLALGEAEVATTLLTKSRATREAELGEDTPDALLTLNDLALAHQYAGRFDQAIPLLEEAVRRYVHRYGESHVGTLRERGTLAQCYHMAGKIDRALELYEELRPKMIAAFGPDSSDALTHLGNLGVAYHAIGKYDKALPLFEQVYKRSIEVNGPTHPDTLRNMTNLAGAYDALGRVDEALPLQERVFELNKARLGADHPDTLRAMTNIAGFYWTKKKYDTAEKLYEEALPLHRSRHGPTHPHTLTVVASLAANYWAQKRLDKSVPLFEQALAGYEKAFGRRNPETLHTAANLGVNYRDAGRPDDAIPLLQEAFAEVKAYPKLRFAGPALLETYRRAGRLKEAADLVPALLDEARTRLPKESLPLAYQLTNLAGVMMEDDRYAAAEEMLREGQAIRDKKEPDAWSTFSTQSTLGGALLRQKKYADAEPLLVKGFEGMGQREKAIPPVGRNRIPEALDRLIDLYTATNKPDDAKKYKELRAKYREV